MLSEDSKLYPCCAFRAFQSGQEAQQLTRERAEQEIILIPKDTVWGDSDFVTGSLEVVKPFLSREDLGLSPTFQTPNPG